MRIRFVSIRNVGIALGMLLAAASMVAAQEGAQSMEGKTTDQYYKNIQVLKGVPAAQLIPTMRFINHSLGVECVFCHVQGDFTKDDKDTKKTARMMMNMQMAINKDNFNGRNQVTCNSCHNGHNDPVNSPPVPDPAMVSQEAAPAPAAAQLPSSDDVVAKYVQALGGEDALRKITSRVITATREVPRGEGGNPAPAAQMQVEDDEKAPNMRVIIAHLPNGGVVANGFDGNSAWTQDAKGNVTELPADAAARAKRDADFYASLDLKQQYPRMVVRGIQKVNGQDAYVVFAFPAGAPAERLFFDAQSGLLVRRWTGLPSALGNNALQVDYGDYRDAGGIKMPYTIRITDMSANPEGALIHVQKIDSNAPVDNGKFAKPASKSAN